MFSKVGKSKGFTAGKGLFDKAWSAADKYLGEPMNKVAGKMGIEGVWPTTLDRECDKAARILRVFTLDGGVEYEEKLNINDVDAKKKTQRVIKRIPAKALREAKGLAIFTVFRSGLGFSAASGSGVVIARKPDGNWGCPSGLLVHTLGFGFMIGVDVYDVVLLLRSEMAVKSFTHPKVNLGGELALVAGPLGSSVMADAGYQQAPCWSYVKSKGFYAGVQLDGSIIVERQDENARFYGGKYSAEDILSGRVHTPVDVEGLLQTIQAASDRDTKTDQIPQGLAPSEATNGQLDPNGGLSPAQPKEGFGAPPVYDDLDSISVKCSDCGASMSMEELSLHDCSGTSVKPSAPVEARRSVPPPPPKKTRQTSEEESAETHEVAGSSVLGTSKDHVQTSLLADAVEEMPIQQPDHKVSDADMAADMEEIRLDDDLAGDSQIEMTVVDDDLRVEEKPHAVRMSKTPSNDSFRSAKEAEIQ